MNDFSLDPETTARLEVRALERIIGALFEHIQQLIPDARSHGKLTSREADLQLQAFAERRKQSLQLLKADTCLPYETRTARLERLVEAINCARAYYRPSEADNGLFV